MPKEHLIYRDVNKSDKFAEACGIFGIFAPGEEVAKLTYFGLYGLQHRGQESAGIAVADGENILVYKDMGLVSQVFNENNLATLQGHIALGHVRYSTTGSNRWENAQPIYKASLWRMLALVHNGNLVNCRELHERLIGNGSQLTSTSDSEIITELIVTSQAENIKEAIIEACKQIRGAYSLILCTENKLIAIKDPYGIRPLCLGKLKNGYVFSSETSALDLIGAEFVKELEPGEMIIVDENGLKSEIIIPKIKPSLCIFEFIYFARPDSLLYDRNLYHVREHMGRNLAIEHPAQADLVIPVPDSGNSAAVGYAKQSGIPFGEGLIKNRYIGRTFIQPSQTIREMGVRLKLNPLKETIAGKRIVVVDDSIVRGNTSKQIVGILREAGAKEIHLRISSPPIVSPCFYGIDTATFQELIASSKSVDEIKDFIGADSLGYLSLEGVVDATTRPREEFCMACFNGEYPIEIPDLLKISKFILEQV